MQVPVFKYYIQSQACKDTYADLAMSIFISQLSVSFFMKSNAVNSLLIVFDLCGPEHIRCTLPPSKQAGSAFSPSQTLADTPELLESGTSRLSMNIHLISATHRWGKANTPH